MWGELGGLWGVFILRLFTGASTACSAVTRSWGCGGGGGGLWCLEGVVEGQLVQLRVLRSPDRLCHGRLEAGGEAGLVQLAGAQLAELGL